MGWCVMKKRDTMTTAAPLVRGGENALPPRAVQINGGVVSYKYYKIILAIQILSKDKTVGLFF